MKNYRLRKKETEEGVVRGEGDSSYLACNPERRTSPRNWSRSGEVGGGKVWEPCVILIGLMPTSYNTLHTPFLSVFHPPASVFFSHPRCSRPLGSQWPPASPKSERMESSARFFRGNSLRPRHRQAFHEISFVKTISCRFESLSRGCIPLFNSDLSNFFLGRRRRVFCSSMRAIWRNWEYCFSRFYLVHSTENIYKEFEKESFFLLPFLRYRITNSICYYNYHIVIRYKSKEMIQMIHKW